MESVHECCYLRARERVQELTKREKPVKLLRKIRTTRSGATLFECAIIMALVAMVAVLVLRGIGGKTNNMLVPVNAGFN